MKEIERKYLLNSNEFISSSIMKYEIVQGYIPTCDESEVRIRSKNEHYFITVKSKLNEFCITREEVEVSINPEVGKKLMDTILDKLIHKVRYIVSYKGLFIEVDMFLGDNTGLVLAEIELDSEDQILDLPTWIGKEVSYDPKYYNNNLINEPFSGWKNE